MIKKSLLIICVGFLAQLVISCFPCRCPESRTFNVVYNEVMVTPYNTVGFQDRVVMDSVPKNAFGLTIQLKFDTELTYYKNINCAWGFEGLYACDCIGDQYLYPNPISKVEVFTINALTDAEVNSTENFKTYNYYNSDLIEIDEFFENREDWHDGFQFELIDYNDIPLLTKFKIIVILKSGDELIANTNSIKFY